MTHSPDTPTLKAKAARLLHAAEQRQIMLTPDQHTALLNICLTIVGRQLRHQDVAVLAAFDDSPDDAANAVRPRWADADDEPSSDQPAWRYKAPPSVTSAQPQQPPWRQHQRDAEPAQEPERTFCGPGHANAVAFGHYRNGTLANFGLLANGRCARSTPRQVEAEAQLRREAEAIAKHREELEGGSYAQ